MSVIIVFVLLVSMASLVFVYINNRYINFIFMTLGIVFLNFVILILFGGYVLKKEQKDVLSKIEMSQKNINKFIKEINNNIKDCKINNNINQHSTQIGYIICYPDKKTYFLNENNINQILQDLEGYFLNKKSINSLNKIKKIIIDFILEN